MMMKFIYMFGAATYDQVRQKFFPIRHSTAAYGRIRALRKHGYVQTFWHLKDNKPQKCVRLKEKARPILVKLWKENLDQPTFEDGPIEDALCMNDLHLRFEKLKLFKRMLSHRIIKSSTVLSRDAIYSDLEYQKCSGILELEKEGDGLLFPIELEFTTRSRAEYERKLRRYYNNRVIEGVFYLCTHNETMDLIAKIDREIRKDQDSIVYAALVPSVINSTDPMVLTSLSGTRIGLS